MHRHVHRLLEITYPITIISSQYMKRDSPPKLYEGRSFFVGIWLGPKVPLDPYVHGPGELAPFIASSNFLPKYGVFFGVMGEGRRLWVNEKAEPLFRDDCACDPNATG